MSGPVAYAIVRVEFTDRFEVQRYGASQLGLRAANAVAQNCPAAVAELVDFGGPNTPVECIDCGCAFHDELPCPTCASPLCAK